MLCFLSVISVGSFPLCGCLGPLFLRFISRCRLRPRGPGGGSLFWLRPSQSEAAARGIQVRSVVAAASDLLHRRNSPESGQFPDICGHLPVFKPNRRCREHDFDQMSGRRDEFDRFSARNDAKTPSPARAACKDPSGRLHILELSASPRHNAPSRVGTAAQHRSRCRISSVAERLDRQGVKPARDMRPQKKLLTLRRIETVGPWAKNVRKNVGNARPVGFSGLSVSPVRRKSCTRRC